MILASLALVAAVIGIGLHFAPSSTISRQAAQIASLQAQLGKVSADYVRLSSKYGSLSEQLASQNGPLFRAGQFGEDCPLLVDGTNGPAQMWVACSGQKP